MLRFSSCAVLVFMIGAVGCAIDNASRRHAQVNDRVGGFEITAVDGQPPVRRHHSLHSVLPMILVDPGTHRFALKDGREVTADVEAGKYYETSKAGSEPAIVDPARPKGPEAQDVNVRIAP